jgi:hypothetical protein
LHPLEYLAKIEYLGLINKVSSDLGFLNHLTKMRVLELGWTEAIDLSPLRGLPLPLSSF